jgi:hypothetical protein
MLKKNLTKPSFSVENVQKMLPALDTYHRLTRLIERFGQLDVRIAATRRGKEKSASPAEKPK